MEKEMSTQYFFLGFAIVASLFTESFAVALGGPPASVHPTSHAPSQSPSLSRSGSNASSNFMVFSEPISLVGDKPVTITGTFKSSSGPVTYPLSVVSLGVANTSLGDVHVYDFPDDPGVTLSKADVGGTPIPTHSSGGLAGVVPESTIVKYAGNLPGLVSSGALGST